MSAARLAVFGITGRMGQSLIRALREEEGSGLQLSGALASSGSARLLEDAALEGPPTGVQITADIQVALHGAEVAVDFSVGEAVALHAEICAAAGVPLLVGTTGMSAAARETLALAARRIALLLAPNTSVGVSLVTMLAQLAAQALGASFDIEILEAHHRDKRDAPSGTALALGEAVAQARGQHLSDLAVHDRHPLHAARRPGSIGFSAVRGGDIVGEHTVMFAAKGERVEITHRVSDRQVFARGALRAAAWLIGRPAGLYGMRNVLDGEIGIDSHARHR